MIIGVNTFNHVKIIFLDFAPRTWYNLTVIKNKYVHARLSTEPFAAALKLYS